MMTAVNLLCFNLTRPFLVCMSNVICCYLTTSHEKDQYLLKSFHFTLLGPLYACLALFLLPLYLWGQFIWILACGILPMPDFNQINFEEYEEDQKLKLKSKRTFTFATSNLLLGFNVTGKFQNMPPVEDRLKKTLKSFGEFSDFTLDNVQKLERNVKTDAVITNWPDVDFFLLQEVWDQYFTDKVVQQLRKRFRYFICNVSRDSFSTNLCSGSSGLLIASRYPVMIAKFHPFKNKKRNWQAFISYGFIMAKVNLDFGTSPGAKTRVGFVASLHVMAYQESENLIGEALNELHDRFEQFRVENVDESAERVEFAVIAGDFNSDNMSPGDKINHNHPIFDAYRDLCMDAPGLDKEWAIGTELRQMRIYDTVLQTPEDFKKVLSDDLLRRHYVIDADIQEQTLDLMTCEPKADSEGQILATPNGGKRRIDRIIYDEKNCGCRPLGAAFITRLAALTDHIPFAITLSCDD